MKILLVQPAIYDFSAYDVWIKPLGLLYLSSILKSYGCEVVLLDCLDRNFFSQLPAKDNGTGKYPYTEIEKPEAIKNIPLKYKRYGVSQTEITDFLSLHKDTNYVIITCTMTYWYPAIEEMINITRLVLPKTKILLGGIYSKLMPQHCINRFSSKVDYIFTTNSIYDLLKYLNLPNAELYKHFVNYPPADYTHYKTIWYVVTRFSYGCLNNCSYCASRFINYNYQSKNVEKFIQEIIFLYYTTKTNNFVFYDDALLNNRNLNTIKHLFNKLIKLQLPIRFYTPNGINPKFIDKEIAILMKQLNFTDLRLSLETISDVTHLIVDKKITLSEFEQGLENLFNAGFESHEISVYILAGLPNETLSDVYKSIEYISQYKIRVRLCEMSPVPKTLYFEKLGLDENIEPLLLNNSIFLFNGIRGKVKPWCNYKEFLELKNFVKSINKKNNVVIA